MSRSVRAVLTAVAASVAVALSSAAATGADNSLNEKTTPAQAAPEDRTTPPIEPPGRAELKAKVKAILDANPEINGGTEYDRDTGTYIVHWHGEDKPQVRAQLIAAAAGSPVELEIRDDGKASRPARQGIAEQIFAQRDKWKEALGSEITAAYVQPGTLEVKVAVAEPPDPVGETLLSQQFGVPVSGYVGVATPQAGSRVDDRGSWTAGNWMFPATWGNPDIHAAACTQGYTWRRWADNTRYGGVAKHCYDGGNGPYWYHRGRHLGTLAWTASRNDAGLLRAASNTSWSPTVWVGGPTTTTERSVVSAEADPAYGDLVALSAANSGLGTGLVYAIDVITTGGAVTVTDYNSCVLGDSGAPWLTTYTSGAVHAWGQHWGRAPTVNEYGETEYGCAFLEANAISAAIGASLVFAP